MKLYSVLEVGHHFVFAFVIVADFEMMFRADRV